MLCKATVYGEAVFDHYCDVHSCNFSSYSVLHVKCISNGIKSFIKLILLHLVFVKHDYKTVYLNKHALFYVLICTRSSHLDWCYLAYEHPFILVLRSQFTCYISKHNYSDWFICQIHSALFQTLLFHSRACVLVFRCQQALTGRKSPKKYMLLGRIMGNVGYSSHSNKP